MKRIISVVALAAAVLVPAQYAKAILGIGLHVGQDSYVISGQTYSSLFNVSGMDLVREEMAKPLGIGGYLYLDIIPVVDLEAGFDVYGNKYAFTFDNPTPGVDQSLEAEVAWVRATGWLSVQKNLLKLPMLKFYAGGGLNVSSAAPLANEDNVVEFLGSEDVSLDRDDFIDFLKDKIELNTGFHAEVGLRIKPILVPFSVHARFRQTFVEGIVPGENSFSTIMIGAGLKF